MQKQIAQQQSEIASANAERTTGSRATRVEAEANRQDLTVAAPFDGTVMTRAAEPGEVVQAGTAIVTLLDLSKVYLRGFVPEGQIGKVTVGQPAHVYLDSNPKQAARRVRLAHRSRRPRSRPRTPTSATTASSRSSASSCN